MKPKAAYDDTAIGLLLVKQGVVPDGRDVGLGITPRALRNPPWADSRRDVATFPSDFLKARPDAADNRYQESLCFIQN